VNYQLWGVVALVIVFLLVAGYQYFKKPQLAALVESHVEKFLCSHPAAPAASAAVPPPTAASTGSGGTLTASDAVAAKHAQYDALIAAGQKAQANKAALTAKQAELEALVK